MATEKVEYVNVGSNPAELASGRLLPVGDRTSKVDPKDPMDKALIDDGKLVEYEGGKKKEDS